MYLLELVVKGLKYVHNKSIYKLLYAIAEGLNDHISLFYLNVLNGHLKELSS